MTENKTPNIESSALLEMTSRIVSAYAGKATLSLTDLTDVIGSVSRALAGLSTAGVESEKKELVPAVPIKKSVAPDFIVCLEDGKKLKMLKRHLMTAYGMTPAQYREKWSLPRDYPMVAPNYAATRSRLAKKIGLGTSNRKSTTVPKGPKKVAARKGHAKAAV